MNVLAPINDAAHLNNYIKVGTDEFYIGFSDDDWTDKFGKYSDINRMSGFKKKANKYSIEDINPIIKSVKENGKKIFVTMNANAYSKEEIEYIQSRYFDTLISYDVDGVIASDVNLISALVEAHIAPVASTMCGIYNSDIAKFFYNIGVERMILPRDLSLDEIKSICDSLPNVDFEAFFMRNGCAFSDGYCLGMHGDCGSTCEFIRNHNKRIITSYDTFEDIHDFDVNDYIYNRAFHRYACGMCALFRLKEAGITSLKIVGRADLVEGVCEDIRITKKNLEILNECSSEREYLKKMCFPSNAHIQCMCGTSCYYPEVRF